MFFERRHGERQNTAYLGEDARIAEDTRIGSCAAESREGCRKMRAGGKADGGYLVFYNMPLLCSFAYERQRLFGIGKGHFEILALAHGIAQDESVISVHGERHGYRLCLAVGAHIVSAAGNNQNRWAVGHIRHFS